jgi:hypothetical protein
MSFIGAVASSVRQTLAQYAKEIEHPVLLIGAGNFTVASALRSGGYTGPITACDVSLYTSALGAFLAERPFEISENPESRRNSCRGCSVSTRRWTWWPPSPCSTICGRCGR